VLETNRDILVDNVEVPAGTTIMCLLRSARDQEDAGACFCPERWLGGEEPLSDPFGAGPRFCPGRYLALAEIKSVIAMLVDGFDLTLEPDAPPMEEHYGFTMMPDSLPVLLRPRAGAA